MHLASLLLIVAATWMGLPPAAATLPSLSVPACPGVATAWADRAMPKPGYFPTTQVDVCYDEDSLRLNFTAYNETNFYYNPNYTTNDPIYEYEVMEFFMAAGTGAPSTYLEFEVAPNNATFQAVIYNPSKRRAPGRPYDAFYVADPLADGLTASTTLDAAGRTWTSRVRVPLGLFNVDRGAARGTRLRANFFRIVVDPATFPNQTLGAWSPTDEANFHMTEYFGHVQLV